MIIEKNGNIFTTEAQTIVNTVNCVGVMGKGLALQFKKRYPENFDDYRIFCEKGLLTIGNMFITNQRAQPKYVINFPTKVHWRDKSKIEYIFQGLHDLKCYASLMQIKSIAIPPLGCGLGGLDWKDVKPLIIKAMESLPDVNVEIYEP